ncbi:MAG TPA: serine protease [Acholeplasma sp.]|nr:serine protease [Acholeplasma sp.]
MKNFFKFIKNMIIGVSLLFLVSFFVDIRVEGHSLNQVFIDAGKSTYNFVDDVFDWLKKEPNVSEFKVKKDETGDYKFALSIDFIDSNELSGVWINEVFYTEYVVIKETSKQLTIEIPIDITFTGNEANKTYNLEGIVYTRKNTEKKLDTVLEALAFKSLDDAIVDAKSKSLIGIRNCTQDIAGLSCKSWGSGIVFDMIERTVQVSPFVTKVYYDYYIITNAHVVAGGDAFQVYVSKTTYKSGGELVGIYTIDTDLAIIKITYDQKVLTVLDDDQFDSQVPVELVKNQTIFAIGSPSGPEFFNSVKEGYVLKLNQNTVLDDQTTLCQSGCDSFQTNASQGPGSSGGAVFDTAGRLVGVHFAGDEENSISSDIPMKKVFEAINHIMHPIYNPETE